MSNRADLLLSTVSLLPLVSILLAVWLASWFEPRIAALLQGEATSPVGAVGRTLMWLALGAVFAVPLFDLVGPLHKLVELVVRADGEGMFVGGHGMRPLRCIMKV
jgi:hypothetical protein